MKNMSGHSLDAPERRRDQRQIQDLVDPKNTIGQVQAVGGGVVDSPWQCINIIHKHGIFAVDVCVVSQAKHEMRERTGQNQQSAPNTFDVRAQLARQQQHEEKVVSLHVQMAMDSTEVAAKSWTDDLEGYEDESVYAAYEDHISKQYREARQKNREESFHMEKTRYV